MTREDFIALSLLAGEHIINFGAHVYFDAGELDTWGIFQPLQTWSFWACSLILIAWFFVMGLAVRSKLYPVGETFSDFLLALFWKNVGAVITILALHWIMKTLAPAPEPVKVPVPDTIPVSHGVYYTIWSILMTPSQFVCSLVVRLLYTIRQSVAPAPEVVLVPEAVPTPQSWISRYIQGFHDSRYVILTSLLAFILYGMYP